MINWLSLAANSLWIIALAMALAAISQASWQSSRQRLKLRMVLEGSGYQVIFGLAGILFCAGMALTTTSTLLTAAWGILGVACLASFLIPLWKKPKNS
jgi:hypothetical protein